MINDIVKTELEQKMERAKEGYARLSAGMPPFAFPERSLVREEVIERYQKGLDLFTEVRRTRAAYELALEQHKLAVPGMKQFHAEAMKVARQHFGADEKAMATFGVQRSKRGKRHHHRCHEEGGAEVVTVEREEVTVEREEPKPRRGCVKRGSTRGDKAAR